MKKFFIVGCPRSGTTMVQQALNRHSQIAIPPETKFFFAFLGQSRRRQRRHVARLNADLGVRLPVPEARIRSAEDGRAFYDTLARQYAARLARPDLAYFGDKTPEHTGHLPQIRELFPDAPIVVLVRDGRDVALSLSRVPWASANLSVNFLVWLHYWRCIRAARRLGFPNLYCVRYEDIVADPRRELSGILDFLGLRYEPAVAEGCGNAEGIPRREYAWKERALNKITPERVGLFRRDLTDAQIATLERLGREALPSLGYELTTDGTAPLSLGFALQLSWGLSRFALRLPWPALTDQLLARLSWGRAGGTPAFGASLPSPT